VRHHTTALTSTAADYVVMIGLVELAGLRPLTATPLSALVGAATNFNMNRRFTYHATDVAVRRQLWRFLLVSATSLALNTAGEGLFHNIFHLQYLLARVITSVIVSNGWNYPMMKYFVFSEGATKDA
jgi:putative flippase GtrA